MLLGSHGSLLRLEYWILMNWVNIFFICTIVCIFPINIWILLLCCFQLFQLASLSLGLSHTHFGILKSIQEQPWIWNIVRHHSHVFLISCLQPYSPYPFYTKCRNQRLGFFLPVFVCLGEIFFLVRKYFRLLWSVLTRKFSPNKYCFHLTRECIIVNISLSYVDFVCSLGFKFRLLKAMGCLSCMRTTPKLVLEVLHSSMSALVKSGVFNCSKQVSASLSHLKASLFNSDAMGATVWL